MSRKIEPIDVEALALQGAVVIAVSLIVGLYYYFFKGGKATQAEAKED